MADARGFIKAVHGVRYQVTDVARAVTFYTRQLGFTLQHQQLPAFASASFGDTHVFLSGPGPGGRQIQIEDPDGNPIELFEPAR